MKRSPPSHCGPVLKSVQFASKTPDRPLRMAVDVSWLRPGGEAGGIKPFIYEYLRGLMALEGDRLALIFLTWSSSHAEIRLLARPQDELVCVRHTEPEAITHLGGGRTGELFFPTPPLDLLLRVKADLQYIPVGMPQFACPGIPNISTFVDVLHRDYPATLTAEANAQRENLFKYLIKISDSFQCISHYTAERLHQHFAVPLTRTFCSYIPIQQRLGSIPDEEQEPLVPAPCFLYPANSWKHKNHEFLLQAYRQYCTVCTDKPWNLVLTGFDDEPMRQILVIAENLGLKERVHFLGHLPDREFSRVWRRAGALVFPSLHEGFGIPLLEAMHFGVPILSSKEGSLVEVAGNAALFADACDPAAWAAAMVRLACDETLRTQLIISGHQRLSEFSLLDEVAEFRDMIVNIASLHSSRLWQNGLHADGQMDEMAILCLPESHGPLAVKIRCGFNPTARRLRVCAGLTPLGDFDVPPWSEIDIELKVDSHLRSLVLCEIINSENPNPADRGPRGTMINLVSATTPAGQTYNLFETRC